MSSCAARAQRSGLPSIALRLTCCKPKSRRSASNNRSTNPSPPNVCWWSGAARGDAQHGLPPDGCANRAVGRERFAGAVASEPRPFDDRPRQLAPPNGSMSTRTKTTNKLSELEIDQIVAAQADDDTAWEQPIRVERSKPASLSLPGDLAARAAFLAQLHRTKSVEEWLTRAIQERIELEEAVFVGIKQDLAVRTA